MPILPLPDQITIWTEAGQDGGGAITWSVSLHPSRNADKQEKFITASGNEQISKALTYSGAAQLVPGARVAFGDHSGSPAPVAQADDVKAVTGGYSGAGNMKKAWL